jgi:hypothetical protein
VNPLVVLTTFGTLIAGPPSVGWSQASCDRRASTGPRHRVAASRRMDLATRINFAAAVIRGISAGIFSWRGTSLWRRDEIKPAWSRLRRGGGRSSWPNGSARVSRPHSRSARLSRGTTESWFVLRNEGFGAARTVSVELVALDAGELVEPFDLARSTDRALAPGPATVGALLSALYLTDELALLGWPPPALQRGARDCVLPVPGPCQRPRPRAARRTLRPLRAPEQVSVVHPSEDQLDDRPVCSASCLRPARVAPASSSPSTEATPASREWIWAG